MIQIQKALKKDTLNTLKSFLCVLCISFLCIQCLAERGL